MHGTRPTLGITCAGSAGNIEGVSIVGIPVLSYSSMHINGNGLEDRLSTSHASQALSVY